MLSLILEITTEVYWSTYRYYIIHTVIIISESLNAAPMHEIVEVVDRDHNYSKPLHLWSNYLSKKVHYFWSSNLHQYFRNFLPHCFFLSHHLSSSPSYRISKVTRKDEIFSRKEGYGVYQECLQLLEIQHITQLRQPRQHPLLQYHHRLPP